MSDENSKLVASQEVDSPLQLGSLINNFKDPSDDVTELDEVPEGTAVHKQSVEPSTAESQEEEKEEKEESPAPPPRPWGSDFQDEQEEEEEDEQEEEEEEEEPSEEPGDYSDYSEAALVAENYKRSGAFPSNLEIEKDMSWPDLMDLMNQNNQYRYEQAVRDFLEQAGQTKEYIEFVLSGGSKETLDKALSLEQLTQVDLEEESNREQLIAAMYRDKGMDDEENIQTLIEGLKLKDKDSKEAEKAQAYFKEKRTKILEYERRQRQERDEYQRRMIEQEENAIIQTVQSGDLGPIKLEGENAKKDFLNALFKPTIDYQYQDEQGNTQTVKITRYQARMQELQNDVKGRLLLAKLVLDADDLQSVKEQGKQESNQDILRALEARTSKKSKRKSKPASKPVWSTPLT